VAVQVGQSSLGRRVDIDLGASTHVHLAAELGRLEWFEAADGTRTALIEAGNRGGTIEIKVIEGVPIAIATIVIGSLAESNATVACCYSVARSHKRMATGAIGFC